MSGLTYATLIRACEAAGHDMSLARKHLPQPRAAPVLITITLDEIAEAIDESNRPLRQENETLKRRVAELEGELRRLEAALRAKQAPLRVVA